MLRTYYLLTKPGIIFGNLLTTLGGFALASRGVFNPFLLLTTTLGIGFVIASACIFNNYIDRDIDRKMVRTRSRGFAKGTISTSKAIALALFLGLLGLAVLAYFTNFIALSVALLGFLIYVALYSLWKTRTQYATLIGSIAGALPPVIGYTAVSARLDAGALLLFFLLVLWQMPHFYAIALYRQDDYAAAAIPTLPALKGPRTTKIHMLLYVAAFFLISLLLALQHTGIAYLAVALPLGAAWIYLSLQGFKQTDDRLWARAMFRLSLLIITALCLIISLEGLYYG